MTAAALLVAVVVEEPVERAQVALLHHVRIGAMLEAVQLGRVAGVAAHPVQAAGAPAVAAPQPGLALAVQHVVAQLAAARFVRALKGGGGRGDSER